MYSKDGKLITLEQAQKSAKHYGLSLEDWANKYGWTLEGKQNGSTEITPTEEPQPTPAGDSSSGDISLELQEIPAFDPSSMPEMVQDTESYMGVQKDFDVSDVEYEPGKEKPVSAKLDRFAQNAKEYAERTGGEGIMPFTTAEDAERTDVSGDPYMNQIAVQSKSGDMYYLPAAAPRVGEKTSDDIFGVKEWGGTPTSTAEDVEFTLQDEELELGATESNLQYNATGNTTFVDAYYGEEIADLGINKGDFEGWLNKHGYSYDFEQDLKDGVYTRKWYDGFDTGGEYTAQEELDIAREKTLAKLLNDYIDYTETRAEKRAAIEDYKNNPEKYSGSVGFDDIYNSWRVDNSAILYDSQKIGQYAQVKFAKLIEKDKKAQAKAAEEYRKRKAQGVLESADETIGDHLGTFLNGFAEGGMDAIRWVETGLVKTLGLSDAFIKRGRVLDSQFEDWKVTSRLTMPMSVIDGVSVTVGNTNYFVDKNGNVFDIDEETPVNGILNNNQLSAIIKAASDKPKTETYVSTKGTTMQLANVMGNIAFQILGTKGAGSARVAASTRYMATANGFKNVRQYKKYLSLVEGGGTNMRGINNVATFGKKLPFNAGIVDATMFQTFYGAATGYEQTIKAAKEAGLTNAEAESLAAQAMLEMGVLYGLTGPINPRIKAMKNLDDFLASRGVVDKAVRDFLNTGKNPQIFRQSLVGGLTKAATKAKDFISEGSKEVVQENIQQLGEFKVVNKRLNEKAGVDFTKDTYSMKDFMETSVLSFISAGLLGSVNLSDMGFKQSNEQKFINLYLFANDMKGSTNRLNAMVEAGKITQDQADEIIAQANAVKNQANKMPKFLLKSNVDATEVAQLMQEIENAEALKKRIHKSLHGPIDQSIKEANDKISLLLTKAEAQTVEKIAGKDKTKIYNSSAEMRAAGYSDADLNADGFFETDGTIVINLEVASKNRAISVASHELLHRILKAEMANNKNMPKIINELRGILKQKAPSALSAIDKRIVDNRYNVVFKEDGTVEGADIDEYMTMLSDAIALGDVPFEALQESEWRRIGRLIFNALRTAFGNIDKEFTSGQQVFDFIKDYRKSIEKGKLSFEAKAKFKAKVKKAPLSQEEAEDRKKSLSAAAGRAQSALDKMQEEGYDPNNFELYDILNGMASAQLNKYKIKGLQITDMEEAIADVVGRLYTERDVNKFDGRGSLYGYLNGRIKFRILDAFKANPIWVEDFGDIDAEGLTGKEVQKVAVEAVETTEAPKAEEGYKNLLRRRVLEPEVVDAIKAKVMSTVRVMKTRMDESVSKNVTVKPYIAELRKAMGKQADIDLKKAMGGIKDGEFRKFLLKNKAAILENMTTTWLMTAMPNAVQKKVDGQWTSDWKGKKIDRETVATDSAGRTSGAELVRRLPKAATRMSDADFLSNFFNADGSLIRGRKESLAKAMAEEISFDIINEALQDPNSEIRKAFEMRQDLLGVELADNFVAEVSRDIERGNVKYSKTLRNMTASEQLAFENGRSEFTSRIEKLKGKFGNSPTVIRNELKAVYGDTFNNEQYKDIANDLFKILKSISQVEEIAEMWTGEEFDAVLSNMLDDIDFMENVNQLTGSEQTVAALYRNKEAVYQAREALIAQLYKIKPPVEVAKSFLAPTFANSGRIGAFLPNGDMKETTRQDLFFSVADVESEFVGEGKLYSREEWDNADRYTVSAKVNVSHLNGKFDTDPELRRKDVEAAAAALQLTEDIVKGLKGQSPEMQAMILAAMNSGTNTALRLGAPVTHVSVGFKSIKPGDFRYEHATPARVVLSLMYKHYVQGDNSIDIDALKQDYKVAIIPKVMDEIITSVGLGPRQVVGYVPGKTPWWKRYYNIFTRGRVQFALKEYGSENLVGERYAEMYNRVSTFDAAEWAVAVEALEPQTKYSQSVPRAVFMVGGPGAGKTNVGKGLKLGRRGYKVINQDLALEPMKEEAGLPANEQEYTKEQRSMRAKLGAAARKAAEAKMEKYLGLRESMVVDGTGASYNATMKKINALREAGYEVSIVFANTSKDEAIARNKARAERALPDMIVERTWEAVQESAKLYKEEFGNKFYELNTNELKLGEDLPKPFLDKLYKDLEVGEAKYSKSVSKEFNEILERKTGVASYKEFSRIQAQLRGKKKGRFKFFIHPSADDFRGLVHYAFAGKGKQGEADMAWLEEKLLTPYFRGVAAIDAMRQQIKRDFKVVTKQFKEEYKLLGKQVGNSGFTYDHALRVYIWDRQGTPIEGLAKRDKTLLLDAIAKNPELVELADALLVVSRRNEWPEPTEYWEGGSILGDLNSMTEKIGRKKFLAEFIENAEIIFSEENLNKIEALFGSAHREAIEDSLYSMKNGTNRRAGTSKQVGAWLNWVNGSTGAIMFFNRRSALLQMLSFTNFINWSDNNPAMAAAAFANQKQYWKDWAMIFNSDKLKERRGGLKQDVSDAELAAVANRSKNSPQAILAYLLKIGFTPTQIADSMAIATGGAMFYRNRVNTYLKQGMDQAAAEEQAFLDFSKKSDEAQQSSDPALVSQQQRSVLGRMILAFANTPMQYTRLMKKAGQDLINGRGNPLENISKIAYYGFVQNFIFSALQSAMFALLFDDDEEDDEKKAAEQEKRTVRTLNSMLDTVLRGSGIYGAVASTVKNTIMEFYRQEDKGFLADHTYTLLSALNLSPPIGSKARKLYSAIQTRKFEKDNIEQRGWSLTADGRLNIGPNYSILGNVLSGVTNVPMDRVVDELNSITEALDARNESWQRIALALGWKTWDVGARNEEADLIKAAGKEKRKQEGIEKAKETRRKNKQSKPVKKRGWTK